MHLVRPSPTLYVLPVGGGVVEYVPQVEFCIIRLSRRPSQLSTLLQHAAPFSKRHKTKQQVWLRVLWIGLLTVLSVGLLATFDVFTGWAVSEIGVFVVAVIAGVVSALLVRWVHQRRLRNTVQNLKDSALW